MDKRVFVALVLLSTATAQPSPIVQGGEVTFIAPGDPSDPPRIVADFNGWNPEAMTPSGDGRTYTFHVNLDPAARIEYLIAYRDRFDLDPENPLTVPSPAGPRRSELRMPLYQPPASVPMPRTHGTIDELPFTSRQGEHRRIRVYVPASPRSNLPALYVHDGSIFMDALDLPSTLDALIELGEMAPTVVVFVDSVDRHDDYEPGSPFRSVFTNEIVPAIERRYAIARDRRVLMGLSRSTVGALDTCARGDLAFDACVLLAPAIPVAAFPAVLPAAGSSTQFMIETGAYDIPLVSDARTLRTELERRGLSVLYDESPQGHNHTAFRARLPAILKASFPTGTPKPLAPDFSGMTQFWHIADECALDATPTEAEWRAIFATPAYRYPRRRQSPGTLVQERRAARLYASKRADLQAALGDGSYASRRYLPHFIEARTKRADLVAFQRRLERENVVEPSIARAAEFLPAGVVNAWPPPRVAFGIVEPDAYGDST